jgi:TRAP-type C4-dicarboxylate transport system permease large subunit
MNRVIGMIYVMQIIPITSIKEYYLARLPIPPKISGQFREQITDCFMFLFGILIIINGNYLNFTNYMVVDKSHLFPIGQVFNPKHTKTASLL